jgi:hypothetical protein
MWNCGRRKDVGTHNPPAPTEIMRSQDTQAERITFGVELETTIPATAGVVRFRIADCRLQIGRAIRCDWHGRLGWM